MKGKSIKKARSSISKEAEAAAWRERTENNKPREREREERETLREPPHKCHHATTGISSNP
jgi:septal ring factor EnvC (AmiA/AmiB activator)